MHQVHLFGFLRGEKIDQFVDNGETLTLEKLATKLGIDLPESGSKLDVPKLYDELNMPKYDSEAYHKKIAGIESDLKELGITAKLEGMDARFAEDIYSEVSKLYNDYPSMKGYLNFIATGKNGCDYFLDEVEKVYNSEKWAKADVAVKKSRKDYSIQVVKDTFLFSKDDKTGGWTMCGYRKGKYNMIVFNENIVDDYNRLITACSNDATKTFRHPLNCVEPKSIIDHELAHVLDNKYGISKDKDLIALFNELFYKKNNYKYLSSYAFEYDDDHPHGSIQEMIAEGWAEYCNPKARVTAKYIGDIIVLRYLK